MSETSTTVVTPTPAPPPAAVAPVPLTAVPAEATSAAEEPRVKRKYTKRAAKWAKKEKKAAKRVAKAPKGARKAKAKAPKAEKKAKRVAGTKFQGQGPKAAMKFAKSYAKENDTTVGVLVGKAVERYLKTLGWDPEA